MTILHQTPWMDEIIPRLWLGQEEAATDEESLRKYGISRILSLREEGIVIETYDGITNWRITIEDEEDAPLFHHFCTLADDIHCHQSSHQSILVHCRAGMSRSASIVAAYLLLYQMETVRTMFQQIHTSSSSIVPTRWPTILQPDVRTVLTVISEQRTVDPNVGFSAQLDDFSIRLESLRLLLPTPILSLLLSY